MSLFKVLKRVYSATTELNYKQGQYDGKIREYFYTIDHQGRLYLDTVRIKNFTSCFKDIKFLSFFYRNLKRSKLRSYPEFRYISLCGTERNYIRCDDTPFVFTNLIENRLEYNYTKFDVKFQPDKLYVDGNGRIYHPLNNNSQVKVGLVKDSICQFISDKIKFENNIAVGIYWGEGFIKFDNYDVEKEVKVERG